MPIYEYRCKDCEHDFTIIESLKDHEGAEPNCPECKSSSVERVIGSAPSVRIVVAWSGRGFWVRSSRRRA